MLQSVLTIIQLIIGVILTITILLQNQGTGLGAAFGGSSTMYTTRRGADLFLFRVTIALSILFFGISLAILAAI